MRTGVVNGQPKPGSRQINRHDMLLMRPSISLEVGKHGGVLNIMELTVRLKHIT